MVTHKGAATASSLEEIPTKQSLQTTTKLTVGTSAHQTSPLPVCEVQEAGKVHMLWSSGSGTPRSPENIGMKI